MIVACIILNYNDLNTTANLLKKIAFYEAINYIVIVDNNSTDNSFSELCSYKSDKIHIIKSEKNGGYGYGNNFGIKYVSESLKADYTLIINPDVEFSNKLVENLTITLINGEDVAVVSALPETPSGEIQYNAAWNIPSPLKYLLITSSSISKLTKSIYFDKSTYMNQSKILIDCVAGSLLMVKTDTMLNYGMYDESMFLYCEETVLGTKFRNAGYKTILLTDCTYTHHHSISINKSFKTNTKRRKILQKSKIIVLKEYYGWNSLYIYISKFFFILCTLEARCSDFFKN